MKNTIMVIIFATIVMLGVVVPAIGAILDGTATPPVVIFGLLMAIDYIEILKYAKKGGYDR